MEKECKKCRKIFTPKHKAAQFCSKGCKMGYNYTRYTKSETKGICSGTVGAIAELVVCADLMKKGFDVYRAVSPHAYADLIAIKDGRLYQFEVRTARYMDDGKIFFPTTRLENKSVAVVTHTDNKVHYLTEPDLGNMALFPSKKTINESISPELLSLKSN